MGGIYFIDGISKLRPRALSPYESVLDDRRYVDSTLLGERIHAHPGFRFMAATNPEDMEQNPLPEFMRSRLRPVIHFELPEKEETEMILKTHHRVLLSRNGNRKLLECFWRLWNVHQSEQPPAPRDSLQIFSLAQNLAEYESLGGRLPLVLECKGRSASLEPKHLETAFEIFFDDSARPVS